MRQRASSDPTEVKRRLLSALVRFLTPGSWTLLDRLRAGAALSIIVVAGLSALSSEPWPTSALPEGAPQANSFTGRGGRSPAAQPEWEAYTAARPDVLAANGELTVTPRAHPELGSDWPRLRDAHLEAVAQMLELYPNEPLYFLARDSELLYDAARFLLRDEPAALARLHLLNISRGNMRAEHVLDYLAQEGISAEGLRAGVRPVFIDTGFSGTIPRVIAEQFPPDVRGYMRTHLLSSSNSAHPSSRAFLTGLNPAAANLAPSSLHSTIVSYEHLPRITDRSTRFEQVNGRWEAMSPRSTSGSDGTVSVTRGTAYREDLLAHLALPVVRRRFVTRRRIWRALHDQALNGALTPEARVAAYRRYLSHGAATDRAFREAAVRDVLEWSTTTRRVPGSSTALPVLPTPENLGLRAVSSSSGGSASNKNALIAQYPQWAAILENPDAQIPALLAAGDYTTLGAILDVVQDDEIFKIAAKSLGAQNPPSPQAVGLVEALIGKGNANVKGYVARFVLSQAHWADHPELVRALIETGSEIVQNRVAQYVLSQAHWVNHPEFVHALIETGNAYVRMNVAQYVLSQAYWVNHPEFVRALIETGNIGVQGYVATIVMREAHWANHPEFVRALIDTGNADAQERVARDVLSQSHWTKHPEFVRALIETGDATVQMAVASHVLSQSHWANHPEFVRALIETGSEIVQNRVAQYVLSQAHWANHPEFVRALIDTGVASVQGSVATYVLNRNHWANHPEFVRALIDTGNGEVQNRIAQYVLSHSHWANHPEFVRALIVRGDSLVRQRVAAYVLGQSHWSNHPELVRALIETGNPEVERLVGQFVLSQSHWANHPHFAAWLGANSITDPTARRAFLLERLGPPAASSAGCEGGPQLQQVLGVLTGGGT